MAVQYGIQMTKLRNSIPRDLANTAKVHSRVYVFDETVTLASQPTTDTIEIGLLPKGANVLGGELLSSVSLGTSTIAIGIAGTTGKYRAAATFSAADTPTLFGVTANLGTPLAAEEVVFITTAVAALPAAGTLRVRFYYTMN